MRITPSSMWERGQRMCAVLPSWVHRRILQDRCDVLIGEPAVRAAVSFAQHKMGARTQARSPVEGALLRVGVGLLEGLPQAGAKILHHELSGQVSREWRGQWGPGTHLVGWLAVEHALKDLLGPLLVGGRDRGVPLRQRVSFFFAFGEGGKENVRGRAG